MNKFILLRFFGSVFLMAGSCKDDTKQKENLDNDQLEFSDDSKTKLSSNNNPMPNKKQQEESSVIIGQPSTIVQEPEKYVAPVNSNSHTPEKKELESNKLKSSENSKIVTENNNSSVTPNEESQKELVKNNKSEESPIISRVQSSNITQPAEFAPPANSNANSDDSNVKNKKNTEIIITDPEERVDATILVLGEFESGKTTFCSLLAGKSIDDIPSTENFIISVANIGGKKIRVIDSPDYFLGEEKGPANKSLGLRDLVKENYDKLSKYAPDAIVYFCPYFPRFDKISDPYIEARIQLDFENYKDNTFLFVQCDKKMEVKDFQFQGFLKSPTPIPAERRFLLSKTDLEAGKFLSIDSFLEKVQKLPKPSKSIWETIKDYESPGEKLAKAMGLK